MRMRIFIVLSFISFILMACGSYRALTEVREDLYSTVKEYNDLIRLKEFDKAKRFVAESALGEFESRAKAARDVRIVDCRLSSKEFDTATDKAFVKIEFDYYASPSTEKKMLIDNQTWAYWYVKEEGRKRWRLITSLPEFK